MSETCQNTDRELWREREGDYYADSIHVTEHDGIGINCGGLVIVKSLREWHKLAADTIPPLTRHNAQQGETWKEERDKDLEHESRVDYDSEHNPKGEEE